MKKLLEMNAYKVYVIIVCVIVLFSLGVNTYLDSLLYNGSKITTSNKISKGVYKVVDYSLSDNANDYSIIYEIENSLNDETYYVNNNKLSCSHDMTQKDKVMVVYDSNEKLVSCEMKELD